MKFAFDFRNNAREALAGKWWLAVVAGLIASVLGGGAGNGPQIKVDLSEKSGTNFNFIGHNFSLDSPVVSFFIGAATVAFIAVLVLVVAYFILASFAAVGYAQFNLDLIDKKEPALGTLFIHCKNWKTTSVSLLLRILYVSLWSLLFIIPGIVAFYSYSMTDYILAENPSLTASQAINKSKSMMSGNKWRLFCLHFSFIGWDILASLSFGIGYLWLTPYKQAAIAAFYRDIYTIECGTDGGKPIIETAFEEASTENNEQE